MHQAPFRQNDDELNAENVLVKKTCLFCLDDDYPLSIFQGELTRVRHDVISFEKQNEVLNEKCREVSIN